MIKATFYKLSASGNSILYDVDEIELKFQGNRVLSSSVPIDNLYGQVLSSLDETVDLYYIILCNNTIHNISKLKFNMIVSLIKNKELVAEFDSLKLAIEAALL
jgi:hypothetical protein